MELQRFICAPALLFEAPGLPSVPLRVSSGDRTESEGWVEREQVSKREREGESVTEGATERATERERERERG